MLLTTKNGIQASASEMLDPLKRVVEQLEADLTRQQKEIELLREERNAYRRMLVEQSKTLFDDPKEWDQFKEAEYTLTIDDLLAVLNAK